MASIEEIQAEARDVLGMELSETWKDIPADTWQRVIDAIDVIDTAARNNKTPSGLTNDLRSFVERNWFLSNAPDRYASYVNYHKVSGFPSEVITWTGERVGGVHGVIRHKPNAFGKNLTFYACMENGVWYICRFYTDAGNYCRLRKMKHAPGAR